MPCFQSGLQITACFPRPSLTGTVLFLFTVSWIRFLPAWLGHNTLYRGLGCLPGWGTIRCTVGWTDCLAGAHYVVPWAGLIAWLGHNTLYRGQDCLPGRGTIRCTVGRADRLAGAQYVVPWAGLIAWLGHNTLYRGQD